MSDDAQRATLVLERDPHEGTWFVVAYLIHDSGKRERATVAMCDSREEASEKLANVWKDHYCKRS
ncbi:MAG: hypothetical protein AAF530_06925 [Pseudomonadota bacterium]